MAGNMPRSLAFLSINVQSHMTRLIFIAVLLSATSISAFVPKDRRTIAHSTLTNSASSRFSTLDDSNAVNTSTEPISTASLKRDSGRVAILVCPAQFCVPDDYKVLFDNISALASTDPDLAKIVTCRVAPLPRTEWIKVARSLPTRAFLEARLPVSSTLKWYFDAIEEGLADIFATEGTDVNICIVGHSIGGWVARAYLGGLSRSSTAVSRLAAERCTSLITLGTPHSSPEDALVDQTRGLLREIAESSTCRSQALADRGIDITCVCSSSVGGSFFTTNVEELVAASSYLPLLGRIDPSVKGDGIVPLDLAFMESPARRVVLDTCSLTNERVRHCHVLPTPWNLLYGYAPSIGLPDSFPSYVSNGVVQQWIKYLR
jgi:hypothetical protein